jgi:Mn2+/Fe2+ NRAMP family transporter
VRYAIAIWVLSATQEYARTRLASMGYSEIGVVTPTERPILAIFMFLIIFLYYFGFEITEQIAIAFIALQIVSFLMVMKMARSILR